ncbi:elongation factor 1-gamma [Anabrus simplex]|uniref:elongation factor 1-gamma n=1 Tax=Anabrus simplex TaxID=316456 RepID=UPI0034DD7422
MASGTLYTYPENFRAYKVLIAAQYAGSNVKIAPGFVFGETNKTETFLKKFPLGKVPAFETGDGHYLTESNAIAYYVANNQLRGQSDVEKAQILQWLGFADGEILPASCAWVFPCIGIMQYNKQSTERAKEDIKAALGVLDTHLLTRTFLVGERVSLADIGVACTLLHLYQYVLDVNFRKPFQNVNRWFTTIINQPEVKAVIGDFKLCEKAAEFDPKKFAEHQAALKGGSAATKDPGSAKKDKKKEKVEKKKEEKPAPEPAEDLDETELALAAEPKSKDPFEALPKGTFNMDEFKRCYSNEDESKSIPFFWEKFDPENYSIWLGEYKYNNELQKVFMSCNLISGMYQRLDKMRKNAFASMCLFGTDDNSSISGIWVWRGQDLAFELSPDWQVDYESYQWTKLDVKSEDTKKLVQQYFAWTGTDKEGRKFNQGKIFK